MAAVGETNTGGPAAAPAGDLEEPPELGEVTRLLRAGGEGALDEAVGRLYRDLKRLARSKLRGLATSGGSLQPTLLVNEAYLRVVRQRVAWRNSAHLKGVIGLLMARVIHDHIRDRRRLKRDGQPVALEDVHLESPVRPGQEVSAIDLERGLEALAAEDERAATALRLRYYAGMSTTEVAEALGLGERKVKDVLALAKARLRLRLAPGGEREPGAPAGRARGRG